MATACSDQKKAAIKASLAATKARRAEKEMSAYELKLNLSKLPLQATYHLKMLFVEGKRLYNWYIDDLSRLSNRNPDIITYLNKDQELCDYQLKYLSSQMIQAINKQVKDNLSGLKASKEKGRKTGRLSFKSELNSIELAQHGVTFSFKDSKLKLQGLKTHIPLFGLHQIPANADICNAKLIKKPSGIYLKVTVSRLRSTGYGTIGLDFGIKHQITTSEGIQIDYNIPVSKRTKKLQIKLSRQKKGSKNRFKTKNKLAKSHEKDTNKRKDCVNKIIGYFKTFKTVVYQNDSIKGW